MTEWFCTVKAELFEAMKRSFCVRLFGKGA